MSKKKITKTDEQWQEQLSQQEFHVTRQAGTERAFSHHLNEEKQAGKYLCVCCGEPLFSSQAKFDSGTGWPSFFQPLNENAVDEHEDRKFFRTRTETVCASCDAHLGHVFPDGPQPTGLRYCMNGTALKFIPEDSPENKD